MIQCCELYDRQQTARRRPLRNFRKILNITKDHVSDQQLFLASPLGNLHILSPDLLSWFSYI